VKVLALDYGSARTGVAVSDPTGTVARPLEVVKRAGTDAGLARVVELARAEGVERIVVVTPPEGAGVVARAAELLGLEEVWAVGGPQAVSALAYGTETIPAVDKIVGPGSAFVTEAKLLVSHDVAVDLPAGPSEVVVLASEGADLAVAELELAAQS